MSKDFDKLFKLIEKQFEVLDNSISFITGTVDDIEELTGEAYLMTMDTFELLILCRALRDMLEDEL
jgi:hypothetical protein